MTKHQMMYRKSHPVTRLCASDAITTASGKNIVINVNAAQGADRLEADIASAIARGFNLIAP